jgi:4-hydroxybutyryl-CoA dehydratase/vinylacetyl-CoA-Delta-isomerase
LVYPNPMYSNIPKLWCAENFHQAIKYFQDIAGGILATAPTSKDSLNPETRPMIEKYLGAKDGIPTEHRLRLLKLIKDFTSTYEDVLTIHAEGSLAM